MKIQTNESSESKFAAQLAILNFLKNASQWDGYQLI